MKLTINSIIKKTRKILGPCEVVTMILHTLRKTAKQFKTISDPKIFLPPSGNISQKNFPTKDHFSNYLKHTNSDTFFNKTNFSFPQQYQKKSINNFKSCRLLDLQILMAYQQKFFNLLKTLYQNHSPN